MLEENYSEKVIARIKSELEHGCKPLEIEREGEFVWVSMISGLRTSEEGNSALVKKAKYTATDELMDHLDSPEFKNQIYAPKKRGIILIDIAGYSKLETLHQSAVLTLLSRCLKADIKPLHLLLPFDPVELIIPTGDGCYIITDERVIDKFCNIGLSLPQMLRVTQTQIIEHEFKQEDDFEEKIEIRVACHIGECDFFTDIAGNKNCYGDGLNEAARILSEGQKTAEKQHRANTLGTVFISDEVKKLAEPTINYLNDKLNHNIKTVDLGEVADKHQRTRQIWWVNGMHKNVAIQMYSPEECVAKGWTAPLPTRDN
ncbi:hypothetical protein [Maridesulfovibrio salexigens]|uniref:Guanylate cyclase domain-containing protein n=1 Tax=Maridesulfovibrio salexigens (strain ATCC 14822 / DSM 2638 / NCIMB 8403 / VKM B-1763) TaxID=526222 RepID=C6BT23_MARSD|nr:hypothetical protein [Maridesulfovibrio salexigens]ACS79727.1 hypothetical protein Desal_1665 [Maridesulfovibrio salexigens DSM 2638]